MAYADNGKFEIAADGVDPKKVPYRTTRNGHKVPAIGLGTFGSDRFGAFGSQSHGKGFRYGLAEIDDGPCAEDVRSGRNGKAVIAGGGAT